jgi:hypothetical protein
MRYAGMGAQIFVSLGIAVFVGIKIDHWVKWAFPVFVWLLPLAVLCMMIYKLIRETSKTNKADDQK